jgi:acyl carrier protein
VVVIAKESDDDKYLVAYFVANEPIETKVLRDYLITQLPEYMVPTSFIPLDHLLLTRNGKLDKRALPDVRIEDEFKAPTSEMELNLVGIYSNVLKIDKESVSVSKSFFELGGNSIRVILLISNIKKISDVKLSLKDVFDNPSIEKLSQVIENASTDKVSSIARIEKMDYYQASSAQERIYYQQSLDVNNLGWNISTALEIKGTNNIDKLSNAFQQLIDRHECLRTSFKLLENGVVQQINENVKLELRIMNQNDYDDASEAFMHFVRPFNLSDESLFRVALLKRQNDCDVLFIDVHHIVCDGTSLDIMIKDFKVLYEGEVLNPLQLRYIDYANWQRKSVERMEKQKKYWANSLSGTLPRLELPTMQNRDDVGTYISSISVLAINGDLYESIKKFTSDSKVSNFMFLLSIYYILLSKVSENPDVIIGTDVLGRTQPGFKDIVGTFGNILPL